MAGSWLRSGRCLGSEAALTLPRANPIIRAESIAEETAMEIYCVKCKAKTETRELVEVVMKNGKPAGQGVCVDCGTKKFRIGKLPAGVG